MLNSPNNHSQPDYITPHRLSPLALAAQDDTDFPTPLRLPSSRKRSPHLKAKKTLNKWKRRGDPQAESTGEWCVHGAHPTDKPVISWVYLMTSCTFYWRGYLRGAS